MATGGDVIDTTRVMVDQWSRSRERHGADALGDGPDRWRARHDGREWRFLDGRDDGGDLAPICAGLGLVVARAPVLEDRGELVAEVVRARFQAAEGVGVPVAFFEQADTLDDWLGTAEPRRRVFYRFRARQEAHAVNLSFRAWSESAAAIKLTRGERRFYCARGEHERHRWMW